MKNWVVFMCLILMGCKTDTKPNETKSESVSEVALWSEFPASEDVKNKHIVLISGDEEYRSEEALPQLAKILSARHGFNCTVLYAQDPEALGIVDPNYSSNIPGLEKLEKADLMILFTRFRALPEVQMKYIDDYLLAGKPVIGIRTATHAFNFEDKEHPYAHYEYNYNGPKEDWKMGFGKKILGETWYTHHGHHRHQSTRGIVSNASNAHPILNGIDNESIWGPTDVYGIREPIDGDAEILVRGQSIDRAGDYDKNDRNYGMRESDNIISIDSKLRKEMPDFNPNAHMPPIIWTKSYQLENGKMGKSLTSTIGSSTDMLDEEVRRVFVNGAYYLLSHEVPEKSNVDFVGTYAPSAFAFHSDVYWEEKGLVIR